MTKYHETHNYDNCRLIQINENFSFELWKELIRKNGLNLLCVAVHYSNRYENSEKFLEFNSVEDIKPHVLYLKIIIKPLYLIISVLNVFKYLLIII